MRTQLSRFFLVTLTFIIFLYSICLSSAQEKKLLYAVALEETPVLNTPDFNSVFGGDDGRTLSVDTSGLIRELEWIAFKGTVFTIHDIYLHGQNTIYKVTSEEYPYQSQTGYFVDSRFVKTYATRPKSREINLPSKEEIVQYLWARQDTHQYIWGGNVSRGVVSMLTFYPPQGQIAQATRDLWMLKGLDCSGLLFEATNGYTPRNTSKLVVFGEPVSIFGKSARQITDYIQPLDLIVWPGHVMIVLDDDHAIESLARSTNKFPDMSNGVRIRDLYQVIRETMDSRTPVNIYDHNTSDKQFVIRRWYDLSKNNMQNRTNI